MNYASRIRNVRKWSEVTAYSNNIDRYACMNMITYKLSYFITYQLIPSMRNAGRGSQKRMFGASPCKTIAQSQ